MRILTLILLTVCSFATYAQEQIGHVDSVANAKRNEFVSRIDSLKDRVQTSSSMQIHLPNSKVDSTINAGVLKINQSKDSISNFVREKTSFLDSMQMKVANPLNGNSSNFNINADQQELRVKEIDGLNVPSINQSKDTTIPKVNMPKSGALNDAHDKVNEIKSLPQKKLHENDVMKEISELNGKAGAIKSSVGKVEQYSKDIQNIKDGELEKVKTLPKDAEQLAVKNVSELKELQNETNRISESKNMIEQYKEMADKINKDQFESQGKDLVRKELIDHFTPNIEKLKGGVTRLDQLKKKYGNIADSRYLPKRAPNDLKEKPFVERIVPGINMQVLTGNVVKIDLSPFAMYRITRRWRAGIGSTKRIGFGSKFRYVDDNVTYGIRTLTDYNFFGGLHVHAEYELMRTTPYNPGVQSFDPQLPEKWVPGFYAGLLKRYRVSKKVYGNFQVLYNFLYEYNGLYQNKVNIRFGFEYALKKKERKKD